MWMHSADSLKRQPYMHVLSKEEKTRRKMEEMVKGIRSASRENYDHKLYLSYASKQAISGIQEEEIAKGTSIGSPSHAKQVTSPNLSIYHSNYSRHTLALIIMELARG